MVLQMFRSQQISFLTGEKEKVWSGKPWKLWRLPLKRCEFQQYLIVMGCHQACVSLLDRNEENYLVLSVVMFRGAFGRVLLWDGHCTMSRSGRRSPSPALCCTCCSSSLSAAEQGGGSLSHFRMHTNWLEISILDSSLTYCSYWMRNMFIGRLKHIPFPYKFLEQIWTEEY